jgi:ABC-2 type transport system permease protein
MRYLRLYLHFLRFSFSRAFEFRLDFYFRIVMDCVYYAVSVGFFAVLYTRTGLVGGWTLDQAYVFACGYMFVDAINMTVVANNMWMLPIFVNKGDLDYYLVRPVSSLFFLSLREFAANSAVNLVIAAGLLAWAIWRYPEPLGAARVAVFLLLLLNGAFITYLLRLLFITPVFWLHSGRGLDELNFTVEKLGERPHQIYTGWLRGVLLTAVPFAFLSSVPSHVLFSGLTAWRLVHVTGVTGGLFAVAVWFWRRGLRAYSSASS